MRRGAKSSRRSAALLFATALGAAAASTAVLVDGPSAAARNRRRGETVRLTSQWKGSGQSLLVCPVTPLNPDRLTCIGRAKPATGDWFYLVDGEGLKGRTQAARVAASEHDRCDTHSAFDVFVDDPLPTSTGGLVAVRGYPLSPRARSISADLWSGPKGGDERIWLAIDETGDSDPELVATVEECDLPPQLAGQFAASAVRANCIDYWVKTHGSWQKRSSDVFVACL